MEIQTTEEFRPLSALMTPMPGTTSAPASIPEPEYGCDYCHDSGFVQGAPTLVKGQYIARAIACPRCTPIPESQGLPDTLRGKTFADFDLRLNPQMAPAYDRVQAIVRGEEWCALLSGRPGLGKSLLAAAALHETFGHFWVFGALLLRMRRQMFDDHKDEEELLRPWQEGRFLLVLDDVGAERSVRRNDERSFADDVLYAILSARESSKLPTIITTNTPERIDERILSRYHTGIVDCRGQDVRKVSGR